MKGRALRISPTEDLQLRRLLKQIHVRNASLRLPLRNRRLSRAATLTTSPARNPGHGPNLFGLPGFRGQDHHRDLERSARPRVRSCASRNFLRGAATHGCKEYHCKQTVRTIVDKPVPIALRTLWRNHTGSSASAECSQFAARRMRLQKFLRSKHDKISPATDVRARFPATAALPYLSPRMLIREFRNSGRHGFARRDDTALSGKHRREFDARSCYQRDRHSEEISVDRRFFHPAVDARCAIATDCSCAARFHVQCNLSPGAIQTNRNRPDQLFR